MKVLIAGRSGYVGGLLASGLTPYFEVLGLDVKPFASDKRMLLADLCDLAAIRNACRGVSPDLVIHAAGNKDIAICEANPESAFRSNTLTVENLCKAFPSSRILYLSTDYVFDGASGGYAEDAVAVPGTVYGASKLKGELVGRQYAADRFFVARISALYDSKAAFVRFLLDSLSSGKVVDCYDDARYSPTYYKDIISAIRAMAALNFAVPRTLHVCGKPLTRYDFARELAMVFGFPDALVGRAKAAGTGRFFFPDLSLDSSRTTKALGSNPAGLKDALAELKKDVKK